MYSSVAPYVGWIATFAVCGFAFWRGSLPERFGAALFLSLTVVGSVILLTVPAAHRPVPLLIGEGVLAVGFLALAVCYASLWLGAAMLFQAVQFSLAAFYLVDERDPDRLYALINNLDTLGILVSILVGTLTAVRRRAAPA